jgi:hypothetical protein
MESLYRGVYPMHDLCMTQQHDIIENILKKDYFHGIIPSKINGLLVYPVHCAVLNNDIALLSILHTYCGNQIFEQYDGKVYPFYYACALGHYEVARYIKNSDVNNAYDAQKCADNATIVTAIEASFVNATDNPKIVDIWRLYYDVDDLHEIYKNNLHNCITYKKINILNYIINHDNRLYINALALLYVNNDIHLNIVDYLIDDKFINLIDNIDNVDNEAIIKLIKLIKLINSDVDNSDELLDDKLYLHMILHIIYKYDLYHDKEQEIYNVLKKIYKVSYDMYAQHITICSKHINCEWINDKLNSLLQKNMNKSFDISLKIYDGTNFESILSDITDDIIDDKYRYVFGIDKRKYMPYIEYLFLNTLILYQKPINVNSLMLCINIFILKCINRHVDYISLYSELDLHINIYDMTKILSCICTQSIYIHLNTTNEIQTKIKALQKIKHVYNLMKYELY